MKAATHYSQHEAFAKAQRIVTRRFRYADARAIGGYTKDLLEKMREIAIENVEAMLQLDMDAFSEERTVLNVLSVGGLAMRRQVSPESLIHGRLRLSPMPGVLERLAAYARSGSDSTEELQEIIRHDIVLTLSLLRLVHSPLFSRADGARNAASVRDAVKVVGSRQLVSLALAAASLGTVQSAIHGLSLTEFWHHSLMTACLARSLAVKAGFAEPERFFTAGLLHDIGRLVMVDRFGRDILGVYGEASAEGIPFHVAEQRVLGFDHGAVGAALLRSWKIDGQLVDAVKEHHAISLSGDHSEYAAVVAVADFMARALGYTYWTDMHVLPPASSAWLRLGISVRQLGDVSRESYAEFERALHVFEATHHIKRKYAA